MSGEDSHEDDEKAKFSKERSSDSILRLQILLQPSLAIADLKMRDLGRDIEDNGLHL